MDEIVKELREDKKRAWEMITSLNERLSKSEKQGKDDELHSKMDKILTQLEMQSELKLKVDFLTDELQKSQGYISTFVESHEELREKMDILTGKVYENVATGNDSRDMKEIYGRDEELQRKMDMILSQHEYTLKLRQDAEELKAKLEILADLVKKLANNVNNSKEIMKIKDTVETTEGYVELFVSDFNQLHKRSDEIADAIQRNAPSKELFTKEFKTIRSSLDGFEGKMSKFSLVFEKVGQLETKICSLANNITVMQKKLDENGEMVQKNHMKIIAGNDQITEFMRRKAEATTIENDLHSLKVNFETFKQFLSKKMENSNIIINNNNHNEKTKDTKEIVYRCCNANCNTIIPKEAKFEEDGVTVFCPNKECGLNNIVGKLKPGYKWMGIFCRDQWHRQQLPETTKEFGQEICRICGKIGTVIEQMVSSVSNVTELRRDDQQESHQRYSLAPRLKCYNLNCKHILPRHFELRDDGVSVGCPNCCVVNIVGRKKEGHRWIRINCGKEWHYRQIHNSHQPGEIAVCQLCGQRGKTLGKNALTAIHVS